MTAAHRPMWRRTFVSWGGSIALVALIVGVLASNAPADARGGINWRLPPPDCAYERRRADWKTHHDTPYSEHRPLGVRISTFCDTVSNACYFLPHYRQAHADQALDGPIRPEID